MVQCFLRRIRGTILAPARGPGAERPSTSPSSVFPLPRTTLWLLTVVAVPTALQSRACRLRRGAPLGRARLAVLFLAGGIAAELIALWWQPARAGNSVANFSVAGGRARAVSRDVVQLPRDPSRRNDKKPATRPGFPVALPLRDPEAS